MKCLGLFVFSCLSVFSLGCVAQDLHFQVQSLKTSYAASGSIVSTDDHTLVIEPNMPAPMLAMPKSENGQTTWSYYAFPLASITVPLAEIDETLIGEDRVFTNPEAAKAYKPGDSGDATLVVVVGKPGKQFHTLTYDRDKLALLGPGPHSSTTYGQAPDDVMAFGLTFADQASAHAFVSSLRKAVLMARAQTVAQAQPVQP
jgi:hypothetical protein